MRPERHPDVLARDLSDGETALLSANGERVLVLNPTASAVWDLCTGERTLAEIVRFIAEHCAGATPERVADDVTALVGELIAAGFLRGEAD